MSLLRRFRRARAGVVAIEFAVVGPLLILLTLGVMQSALLGWTQVVLQLTAAQTARCVALGSTACSNPTTFAVDTANGWLYANAVTSANVTLQTNVTCNGAPGHYARVTITSQFAGMQFLPGILGGSLLSAYSCYYTGA